MQIVVLRVIIIIVALIIMSLSSNVLDLDAHECLPKTFCVFRNLFERLYNTRLIVSSFYLLFLQVR